MSLHGELLDAIKAKDAHRTEAVLDRDPDLLRSKHPVDARADPLAEGGRPARRSPISGQARP